MASARRRQMHARRSDYLPFCAVNRPGRPGYAHDLQRHHILPRQAIGWPSLQALFHALGIEKVGFDDFRRNGMLLPARESAALRLGLPLHLGPHRDYNRMVIDLLGMIEASWSCQRPRDPARARDTALARIYFIQVGLRRQILDHTRPLRFNRADPLGHGHDFAPLDRMAEDLWTASAI